MATLDHTSHESEPVEEMVFSEEKLPCTICSTPVKATDLYWKGVDYCSHGIPLQAVPVCYDCIRDVETQAGENGMIITVLLLADGEKTKTND